MLCFVFQFANLLGSVYHKGNLVFTPDGETILSPVGNKVTLYDLKRSRSQTMPVESHTNITALALSPNGRLLITVNERGEALLISMASMAVVHRHRFHRPVRAVQFSPDGRYFALTKENLVFVYRTPGGLNRMYNPFVLERVLQGSYDATLSLAWTSDSRLVAAGSDDMSTRIYPIEDMANFGVTSLGGHSAAVLGVFFESESLDCYTVSRSGQLCCWTCTAGSDSDDDDRLPRAKYKQRAKHFLLDVVREGGSGSGRIELSSADFHRARRVLVTGYTNGAFLIHEMPDAALIHSLSVSDQVVSSVALSPAGDWVGLACSGLGQLLVWEWQSETYILKQQGHQNNMTSLAYAPGGDLLVTGGEDGKVKVWNTLSGFCFVTFVEHSAAVSGVAFTQSGKAVLSASLDGTVRAFDLTRYRNFRTLTSPRPAQFACLAVDSSGELVAAGAQDLFEIYLWSLQLGKLLEVMSGHEGPVAGLAFSPDPTSTTLASVSWDKTLRPVGGVPSGRWCLSVAYRPDGGELAVATLSGQIQLFDPAWAAQTGAIEGRADLGSGRADADHVTAKTSLQAKAFSTLCYTADGRCLLAAGHSKNVCIYHCAERLLMAKFEITQNRSFDAVDDFIHKRKMT
ncbi:Periodic tryptophan protein 2 [Amphibalanus amphitrite]|uniref:Periodic tryptophan protein 2 n=1 Tax=Amphibalanus amphitrite TaxID=1232801 RepID=A0A6A4W473_AMPAM|nr:Periodic tryptophan protein 2 [Amphibalanus amphitrite]